MRYTNTRLLYFIKGPGGPWPHKGAGPWPRIARLFSNRQSEQPFIENGNIFFSP